MRGRAIRLDNVRVNYGTEKSAMGEATEKSLHPVLVNNFLIPIDQRA